MFSAPELIHGEEPTEASDMWSCGATLYLLLSGKTPFESDTLPGLLDQIKTGNWTFKGITLCI